MLKKCSQELIQSAAFSSLLHRGHTHAIMSLERFATPMTRPGRRVFHVQQQCNTAVLETLQQFFQLQIEGLRNRVQCVDPCRYRPVLNLG